jgi:hypothetical protein
VEEPAAVVCLAVVTLCEVAGVSVDCAVVGCTGVEETTGEDCDTVVEEAAADGLDAAVVAVEGSGVDCLTEVTL